jgi:hypothetical protein
MKNPFESFRGKGKKNQEKFAKKLEHLDDTILIKAGINRNGLIRAMEFLSDANAVQRKTFKDLLDSTDAMINPELPQEERKQKVASPYVADTFDSDIMMIWLIVNPIPFLETLEEKKRAMAELHSILEI